MVPLPQGKIQFSIENGIKITLNKLIPIKRVMECRSPTSAFKIVFKWDLNDIWSLWWTSSIRIIYMLQELRDIFLIYVTEIAFLCILSLIVLQGHSTQSEWFLFLSVHHKNNCLANFKVLYLRECTEDGRSAQM